MGVVIRYLFPRPTPAILWDHHSRRCYSVGVHSDCPLEHIQGKRLEVVVRYCNDQINPPKYCFIKGFLPESYVDVDG